MISKYPYCILFIYFLVTILTLKATTNHENFQHFLNDWRREQKITSVVVSIEDLTTKKVTTYSSGFIKRKGTEQVTSKTLFGIGSITKTFVAATLLQLQEEGKIKLDDPIGPYFLEYPRWKSITIRQLLNMTSGIANIDFSKERDIAEKSFLSPKKIIDDVYATPDLFTPGSQLLYSNTNYFLLSVLIEKILRKPFAEVLTTRFFKPLDLRYTFYSDSFYAKEIVDQMAHAYAGKHDVTAFNASHYGPAGSMVSNSTDLLTWAQALLTPGTILSEESIRQMETTIAFPSMPPKPEGCRYGLGIYSLNLPHLGIIWYYAGVIRGYTSCFVYVPSQQKIIVAQVASWPGEHFEVLFPNQPLMKKLLVL